MLPKKCSVQNDLFFLTPQTDNTKCSQSSYLRMRLISAPTTSIKPRFQNWTQEIESRGLVFPHPKGDITAVAVSIVLIKSLFVQSDVIS